MSHVGHFWSHINLHQVMSTKIVQKGCSACVKMALEEGENKKLLMNHLLCQFTEI